jgi:hypothetical protein
LDRNYFFNHKPQKITSTNSRQFLFQGCLPLYRLLQHCQALPPTLILTSLPPTFYFRSGLCCPRIHNHDAPTATAVTPFPDAFDMPNFSFKKIYAGGGRAPAINFESPETNDFSQQIPSNSRFLRVPGQQYIRLGGSDCQSLNWYIMDGRVRVCTISGRTQEGVIVMYTAVLMPTS